MWAKPVIRQMESEVTLGA